MQILKKHERNCIRTRLLHLQTSRPPNLPACQDLDLFSTSLKHQIATPTSLELWTSTASQDLTSSFCRCVDVVFLDLKTSRGPQPLDLEICRFLHLYTLSQISTSKSLAHQTSQGLWNSDVVFSMCSCVSSSRSLLDLCTLDPKTSRPLRP